jgi:hypothetical protein
MKLNHGSYRVLLLLTYKHLVWDNTENGNVDTDIHLISIKWLRLETEFGTLTVMLEPRQNQFNRD